MQAELTGLRGRSRLLQHMETSRKKIEEKKASPEIIENNLTLRGKGGKPHMSNL